MNCTCIGNTGKQNTILNKHYLSMNCTCIGNIEQGDDRAESGSLQLVLLLELLFHRVRLHLGRTRRSQRLHQPIQSCRTDVTTYILPQTGNILHEYKHHQDIHTQALFHFCSFKILNKIQNLLKNLKLIQGGIEKIPPHHVYQIYHFLSERDDCTPPKQAHSQNTPTVLTLRWRILL